MLNATDPQPHVENIFGSLVGDPHLDFGNFRSVAPLSPDWRVNAYNAMYRNSQGFPGSQGSQSGSSGSGGGGTSGGGGGGGSTGAAPGGGAGGSTGGAAGGAAGGASGGGAAGGAAGGTASGGAGSFDWAKWISGLLGVAGAGGFGGSGGGGNIGPVSIPGGVVDPRLYNSAYGNLYKILISQGRTDPLAMNREMTAIGRGGAATADAVRGDAARSGYGTGLNAALQAAIGQGTSSRQQGVIARENQLAEERKRRDLDLFLRLVLDPNIQYQALATGQYNANREDKNNQNAAQMEAWAKFLDGLSRNWGSSSSSTT